MRSNSELRDKEESKLEHQRVFKEMDKLWAMKPERIDPIKGLQKGIQISLRLGERDLIQMNQIIKYHYYHSFEFQNF